MSEIIKNAFSFTKHLQLHWPLINIKSFERKESTGQPFSQTFCPWTVWWHPSSACSSQMCIVLGLSEHHRLCPCCHLHEMLLRLQERPWLGHNTHPALQCWRQCCKTWGGRRSLTLYGCSTSTRTGSNWIVWVLRKYQQANSVINKGVNMCFSSRHMTNAKRTEMQWAKYQITAADFSLALRCEASLARL